PPSRIPKPASLPPASLRQMRFGVSLFESTAHVSRFRTMQSISYHGHTIRRWQVGDSTFLAWPEAGARLMHWSFTRADGSGRAVVHRPDLASLDQPVAKGRGGTPLLFPFRAPPLDRGDIHSWRDPAGRRRPLPMHGFARQGTFRI